MKIPSKTEVELPYEPTVPLLCVCMCVCIYIYTEKTIKRTYFVFETTCVYLKNIMLNEINQTETNTVMISLICGI